MGLTAVVADAILTGRVWKEKIKAEKCCKDEQVGTTYGAKASIIIRNHLGEGIFLVTPTILDQAIGVILGNLTEFGDLADQVAPLNKVLAAGAMLPWDIYGVLKFECCTKNQKMNMYGLQ